VERLDLFLNGHSSAVAQSLFSTEARIESIALNYVFLLAIGIGIVAGLRSLTAPAVVAWGAHLSWLNLHGSPLAFMGSTTAVTILSVLAIGELIADKLPMIPKRTAPAPLMARVVTGGLCGACLCAAVGKSLLAGTLLGGIGGIVGAFSATASGDAWICILRISWLRLRRSVCGRSGVIFCFAVTPTILLPASKRIELVSSTCL